MTDLKATYDAALAMVPELLPCPFCGGAASPDGVVRYGDRHAEEQGWKQSEFYYCNCMHCGVSNKGIVGHNTRDDAVAAWNRRSPVGLNEKHGNLQP